MQAAQVSALGILDPWARQSWLGNPVVRIADRMHHDVDGAACEMHSKNASHVTELRKLLMHLGCNFDVANHFAIKSSCGSNPGSQPGCHIQQGRGSTSCPAVHLSEVLTVDCDSQ